MLAYYYLFTDGPVLQTPDMAVITDTMLEVFKDDLQGRLLNEAGNCEIPAREITVVLVTDIVVRRVPSLLGMQMTHVARGPQYKEIILGRVIRTPQTHEVQYPDATVAMETKYGAPFETIRAEVPEQYGKKTVTLPSFLD